MQMWARHEEIRSWVAGLDDATAEPVRPEDLDAPVPVPPAIIAIGLNYAEHARETGFEPPTELPPVFAKFPSSITGAHGEVELPEGGTVDWEVEVVAVVGAEMHHVAEEDVFAHLAGLTIGQDLSERTRQFSGPGAAVRAREVLSRVRADRAVGRLPRRVRRPGRPGSRVQHRRRGRAVRHDGWTHLLDLPIDRRAVPGARPATGRPRLHRHAGRRRDGPTSRRDYLQRGEVLETWVEGIGRMSHRLV